MTDLVTESLERAAEVAGDITAAVYAKYFERCPASRSLMLYIDDTVRGRMLQEVLRLFFAEDVAKEQAYLHFETHTHRGYGVEPAMYGHLFSSLRDTVREALAGGWNADYAAAWEAREANLLRAIDEAVASP
jgi:hemoglobin-like flavoprotein